MKPRQVRFPDMGAYAERAGRYAADVLRLEAPKAGSRLREGASPEAAAEYLATAVRRRTRTRLLNYVNSRGIMAPGRKFRFGTGVHPGYRIYSKAPTTADIPGKLLDVDALVPGIDAMAMEKVGSILKDAGA